MITRRRTASELNRMLVARLESVLPQMLDDVRQEGEDLRGRARSDGAIIKVGTKGRLRGVVLDTAEIGCRREGRRGGSLLNLATAELGAGDIWRGCRAAERLVGIDRADWQSPPVANDNMPEQRAAEAARREAELAVKFAARRQSALNLLAASVPIGDAAGYLVGRGIGPAAIGPEILERLRFHPACSHPADRGIRLPAMLAEVTGPSSGEILGVHRTYLSSDGDVWRKANWSPAKAALGPIGGGLIELLRGPTSRPLFNAEEGAALILAEGIENALSAALLRPGLRAAASLSVSNLSALRLPPAIRRVVLVRDRDGSNGGVRIARERAITRWLDEGRVVDVIDPPPSQKDMNDELRACLAGGVALSALTPAPELDPAQIWSASAPIGPGTLAASLVERWAGHDLAALPVLTGLAVHPGLPAAEFGGALFPAIIGGVVAPGGQLRGVVAWLLRDGAGLRPMRVPRYFGDCRGGAIPLTGRQLGVNGDVAVIASSLRASLASLGRRRRVQLWLVPTPAHLVDIALPEHLRRVGVLASAEDASFADEVFVAMAIERLAPGRQLVRRIPAGEPDGQE